MGMRPNTMQKEFIKNVPGPGNYNIQLSFKKTGSVFGTGTIGELQSNETLKMPGPGAYNVFEASAKIGITHKIGYFSL
jgi:hypothetical protein